VRWRYENRQRCSKNGLARRKPGRLWQYGNDDVASIQQLQGYYIEALEQSYQYETADHIHAFCIENTLVHRFVKIIPQVPAMGIQTTAIMIEDPSE
jgi:hypothetical protein